MQHHEFINQLDETRVIAAIQAAEARTSGEIRVDVSHRTVDDVFARAQQRFTQLGMQATRDRNGVLIFVAPRSQKFAVIGDAAVHQRCGDMFWRTIVEEMTPLFREGRFTDAIELALRKTGDVLAEHFPRRPDDRNELPDSVTSS